MTTTHGNEMEKQVEKSTGGGGERKTRENEGAKIIAMYLNWDENNAPETERGSEWNNDIIKNGNCDYFRWFTFILFHFFLVSIILTKGWTSSQKDKALQRIIRRTKSN